ncbi:hypothetical protein DSECCO2_624730 [anaerobic digester metagenome]
MGLAVGRGKRPPLVPAPQIQRCGYDPAFGAAVQFVRLRLVERNARPGRIFPGFRFRQAQVVGVQAQDAGLFIGQDARCNGPGDDDQPQLRGFVFQKGFPDRRRHMGGKVVKIVKHQPEGRGAGQFAQQRGQLPGAVLVRQAKGQHGPAGMRINLLHGLAKATPGGLGRFLDADVPNPCRAIGQAFTQIVLRDGGLSVP